MKNIKRRVEFFSFYDHTGITAHLEKMALQGWALEKMGNFCWRYRRIEPKKLRYNLVYQSAASEFDARPPEEVRNFEAFCEEAGWERVADLAQMQVYCSPDPNAIPIETDPGLQVQTIHQAMKKNYIPGQIAMMVLAVLQYVLAFWRYAIDPLDFLAGSGNYVALLCYLLIFILSATEVGGYYRWRKKALRSDGFCPTRSHQRLQYFCIAVTLTTAALWLGTMTDGFPRFIALATLVITVVVLLVVYGVKALMKKLGASRGVTRAVFWVTAVVSSFALLGCVIFVGQKAYDANWFEDSVETYEWEGWTWEIHHDALPLNVEDLLQTDYPGYSTQLETELSPLLTRITAAQEEKIGDSGNPNLRYSIYQSPLSGWIRELVVEEYTLRDYWGLRAFQPAGISIPGVAVSRLWEEGTACNTWMLAAEDRIVILSPDWELSGEQLTIAAEKLMK